VNGQGGMREHQEQQAWFLGHDGVLGQIHLGLIAIWLGSM
jgi:hypothetical protein